MAGVRAPGPVPPGPRYIPCAESRVGTGWWEELSEGCRPAWIGLGAGRVGSLVLSGEETQCVTGGDGEQKNGMSNEHIQV